ncbi:MAG: hypothetical protein NVS3B20_21370 [Polyangiales bacterium]
MHSRARTIIGKHNAAGWGRMGMDGEGVADDLEVKPCGSSMTALVIGDLHLLSAGDPGAANSLVDLLREEPDAHVVFAGDALDLPAERAAHPEDATRDVFQALPNLRRALLDRASRRVPTTFIAGNHDAYLATDAGLRALHAALGLEPSHREYVTASPWMTRIASGAVHIEHGHVFEPDGAPAHPLAPVPRDDVGICILRKFIVPVNGHWMVHRNAETPIALLLSVILRFGPIAPYIIARYIAAASTTVLQSGARFPLIADRAQGNLRLRAFAETHDLDHDTLGLLLEAHATPTRARTTDTFLRLYLDRVGATTAMVAGTSMGVAAAAMEASSWLSSPLAIFGLPVAAVGALALVASILAGDDRYGGRAERALAMGAERVSQITGARTVILGHVHVESTGPHYVNTASFAFPRKAGGRSYLRVEDDGTVRRAYAR